MITVKELKLQIEQAKEDLETLRFEKQIRAAKSKAKRLKFLNTCLAYIESTDAEKIVEQRNMLMVKYRVACERVAADFNGATLDLKNKEINKLYIASCKLHGADKMKTQLHTLNFILK